MRASCGVTRTLTEVLAALARGQRPFATILGCTLYPEKWRKILKRLRIGLAVLATLIFLTGIASAADNKPDATLKLTQRGVAIGIGVSWGDGIVTFKGKNYPFKIQGLSVDGVELKLK